MALRYRFAAPLILAVAAASFSAACSGGPGSLPSSTAATSFERLTTTPQIPQEAVDSTLSTPEWLQPFYNGAHTGFNTLETTLNRTNVSGLTQLWSFSTGEQIEDPILAQNGMAFINSGD